MKWFIGLIFCCALCWIGWQFAPNAMNASINVAGLPLTGYMGVLAFGIFCMVSAKR